MAKHSEEKMFQFTQWHRSPYHIVELFLKNTAYSDFRLKKNVFFTGLFWLACHYFRSICTRQLARLTSKSTRVLTASIIHSKPNIFLKSNWAFSVLRTSQCKNFIYLPSRDYRWVQLELKYVLSRACYMAFFCASSPQKSLNTLIIFRQLVRRARAATGLSLLLLWKCRLCSFDVTRAESTTTDQIVPIFDAVLWWMIASRCIVTFFGGEDWYENTNMEPTNRHALIWRTVWEHRLLWVLIARSVYSLPMIIV